ncbi:hypothetical protein E3983_12615 [Legionella israelensis]|uniref:Uncharacterized protein n=1 Tax=Legionella israelensis TaxID=454 RepID=A0AAX1EJ94_9GAMM|nr:hypothetical protein [Legionella israelensis]QBR85118.1 hypothetical protein E3983_12615 [Legionella israelensis]QDP71199.1 hypothetical protein FOG18_00670 [Legionella israelensis]
MDKVDLAKLQQYENSKIIHYFWQKNQHYSLEQCQQFFSDLLAWMGLKTIRNATHKKTYLFGPLLILDELWHVFILHSRDYVSFCHQHFGQYLHHEVEPIGSEHRLTAEELADFLQDCFRHLGESWVKRYFGYLL